MVSMEAFKPPKQVELFINTQPCNMMFSTSPGLVIYVKDIR